MHFRLSTYYRASPFLRNMSQSMENFPKTLSIPLPTGHILLINNHFWAHGRDHLKSILSFIESCCAGVVLSMSKSYELICCRPQRIEVLDLKGRLIEQFLEVPRISTRRYNKASNIKLNQPLLANWKLTDPPTCSCKNSIGNCGNYGSNWWFTNS